MKRILRVHTLCDSALGLATDSSDINFALMDVDARDLLRLRDECLSAMKQDSFLAAEFFDRSIQPFNGEALGFLPDAPEISDNLKAPDGLIVPQDDDAFRMDMCVLRIEKEGVSWRFFEKHCDDGGFRTGLMYWDDIERAAEKES